MKSKKKLIIKIAAVTLAVILLCVGSFGGCLLYRFNCDKSHSDYDYSLIYEQHAPSYDVGEDGKFTVLKINDTHFTTVPAKAISTLFPILKPFLILLLTISLL